MAFFAVSMLGVSQRGYRSLYWLLMATFAYMVGRTLYEWYHYWNIKIDPTPAPEKQYTVDIFTTFCAGEPYEMVVETLEAIQKITYPHTTYLCDEADDPYLKEVCQRLGLNHVTRTVKKGAKAGNINNALQQATGEICLIIDPDHVPFPNFLDPIIGHFNDPQVGYVQVVQAYYNQDEGLVAKGAAQQTYQFYGPMMMTMNAYGTAQAIGANCTFRRAALDSIGGHGVALAEDMYTAMLLHAKGWKSVYVPEVLARGLVPATLSAYFKQQIKWSKGCFELIFTAYPKLFKNFTWRQKLHYGLVPLFYLSGVVYLLNFIIPVISLFADVYPLQMDFWQFALVALPFSISTLVIRHYVQRWVMEDQERGFHIVGGLLFIGTWWIYVLSTIYTLIGKKVPYLPTPKDNKEEKSLLINLPNIAVLVVSVSAIAYGLINDWNPFTIGMAAICSINCWIMVFMLVAGQQHKIKAYRNRYKRWSAISSNIGEWKGLFWQLRRRMYSGIRSVSFMLVVLTVCTVIYAKTRPHENPSLPSVPNKKNMLLTGIFQAPKPDDGVTCMAQVAALQQSQKAHFDIVSVYLPWGDGPQCYVAVPLMDSIYHNHSVPLVTWEPWQGLFKSAAGQKDEHVFAHIIEGRYDDYIGRFADQMRDLNRPVFLRFAHEADNPFYPWSESGDNTAEDFKAAWQHVHDQFLLHGAWNVLWVWNPWKAKVAEDYFPGKAYVDWISVTGLNYGKYNTDGKSYSFRELYMPFHKLIVHNWKELPVMVAEMGAAKDGQDQNAWLRAGIKSVKKDFPEVKALVLFNTAYDKNVPDHRVPMINWQQDSLGTIHALTQRYALPGWPEGTLDHAYARTISKTFPAGIRGVVYGKAQNWLGNKFVIRRKTILTDLKAMRSAGINTIKIFGPTIYDHVTFQAVRETGMKINYSFWVPDHAVLISKGDPLPRLEREILKAVANLKDNHSIIGWNIGNYPLQQMEASYLQPELFYHKQAYIKWLSHLVHAIKQVDSTRPVTVDVAVAPDVRNIITNLHDQAPDIDAFGLVLTDTLSDTDQINRLTVPYYFSSIKPQPYFKLPNDSVSVFMENWQDEQWEAGVTFNGLKDIWGRNKPGYYEVTRHWTADTSRHTLLSVKILRPSATATPGVVLPYHALVYEYNKWHLAKYLPTDLHFEWYQVRTDDWGRPQDIQLLGRDALLNYTIPDHPQHYRLYLVASKGNDITSAYSPLYLPIIDKSGGGK